jgi:hypothetical protein
VGRRLDEVVGLVDVVVDPGVVVSALVWNVQRERFAFIERDIGRGFTVKGCIVKGSKLQHHQGGDHRPSLGLPGSGVPGHRHPSLGFLSSMPSCREIVCPSWADHAVDAVARRVQRQAHSARTRCIRVSLITLASGTIANRRRNPDSWCPRS